MNNSALVIVDMQRYYLEEESAYSRYFSFLYPGSLEYIRIRAESVVIPNIVRIRDKFRSLNLPVIYLRLCGTNPDRSDLHRFFRNSYIEGQGRGFEGVYPLSGDPEAEIIEALKPSGSDIVIDKTTFSAFSSTDIEARLRSIGITDLVFTGLATSQCVETTARDASDRGFDVIHINDAQADYDEMTHSASIYSSRGVCGGIVYDTDEYIRHIHDFL